MAYQNIEPVHNGRATIHTHHGIATVSIPVRKNWFVIAFFSFWMCGWLFGVFASSGILFGGLGGLFDGVSLFSAVWLMGWTLGGLFVLRMLLWMAIGREVATIQNGTITIEYQNLILKGPKTYSLSDARNFRVSDVDSSYSVFGTGFSWGSNGRRSIIQPGVIRFDYGMNTIKFGSGIDEAEGKHILNELRRGGYLLESNM